MAARSCTERRVRAEGGTESVPPPPNEMCSTSSPTGCGDVTKVRDVTNAKITLAAKIIVLTSPDRVPIRAAYARPGRCEDQKHALRQLEPDAIRGSTARTG